MESKFAVPMDRSPRKDSTNTCWVNTHGNELVLCRPTANEVASWEMGIVGKGVCGSLLVDGGEGEDACASCGSSL
jgi:hypothetical protein